MSDSHRDSLAVSCIFGGVIPLVVKLVISASKASFIIVIISMVVLSIFPVIHFIKVPWQRVIAFVLVGGGIGVFAYFNPPLSVKIEYENARDYVVPPEYRPPEE